MLSGTPDVSARPLIRRSRAQGQAADPWPRHGVGCLVRWLTSLASYGHGVNHHGPHHVVLFMAQEVAVPHVLPAEVGHVVGDGNRVAVGRRRLMNCAVVPTGIVGSRGRMLSGTAKGRPRGEVGLQRPQCNLPAGSS